MEPPEDVALPAGVSAELAVQLVARQKAVAVSKLVAAGTYVLSADTIVVGPRGPRKWLARCSTIFVASGTRC